jgi:hypothetical protein
MRTRRVGPSLLELNPPLGHSVYVVQRDLHHQHVRSHVTSLSFKKVSRQAQSGVDRGAACTWRRVPIPAAAASNVYEAPNLIGGEILAGAQLGIGWPSGPTVRFT